MNKENAKKVEQILRKIKETTIQLKKIDEHSFGFGTSFYDIDEFLRPIVKVFLYAKLKTLEDDLNNY